MLIKDARFVISNSRVDKCPKPDKPEYAFIGRSNVGKSSLINMLTGRKRIAKTSVKPGKTRLINHFIINGEWYLVDLPGYGFARITKTEREKWEIFVRKYLLQRTNLYCVFLLIDSRLEPQKKDLEFMEWMGEKGIPFAIVFTKTDKLNRIQLEVFQPRYETMLRETWEELPTLFVSSAVTGSGREEILDYIESINRNNPIAS